MKAGDIIFVRGKSPLSKLVNFFDKGKFSHCAIAVSETHIFEADWYTKAVIKPFHYEDWNYEIVDLGLTDEERDVIALESINLTGRWYDYKQILWYMLKRFSIVRGKNKFNSPNMLICSEAVYDLLRDVGKIPYKKGLNIDVTPNELYAHMMNLKSVIKSE